MFINDNKYLSIIETIKSEINNVQFLAEISVNSELITIYYNIRCCFDEGFSHSK